MYIYPSSTFLTKEGREGTMPVILISPEITVLPMADFFVIDIGGKSIVRCLIPQSLETKEGMKLF